MKNKTFVKILSLVVILACSNISGSVLAQEITKEKIVKDDVGTPEVFNEPGTRLLITEVNFKNKQQDFLKFYYESPSGKPFNFKNFQFADNKVFKKLEKDYWLTSKSNYLLLFNSSENDQEQNLTLATSHKGLIATTKQVMIKDPDGKIIDAVCWSNSNPPDIEKKAIEELFLNGGWTSSDPSSCFPSEKIRENQSIIRKNFNNTKSSEDWTIAGNEAENEPNNETSTEEKTVVQPTQQVAVSVPSPSIQTSPPAVSSTNSSQPPAVSVTIEPQKKKLSKPPKRAPKKKHKNRAPENSPSPAPNFISSQESADNELQNTTSVQENFPSADFSNAPAENHKKNKQPRPPKVKHSKTTKPEHKKTARKRKPSEPVYQDGDISDEIVISEIFPHPASKKGADTRKNKWIELSNVGETPVHLGNWKLVHQESNKKPYIIPDSVIIDANSAMLFKTADIKFPIKNKYDAFELIDPQGNSIQTVEYDEAPKDHSYAFVEVQKENGTTEEEWVWDENPSPGTINPTYHELTGTITKPASFEGNYNFALQTADKKEHTIYFRESLIAGPLAKTTLLTGSQIKILGIPLDSPEVHAQDNEKTMPTEKSFPLQLKKFEIIKEAAPEPSSNLWPELGLIPVAIFGSGIWIYRKRKKAQTADAETKI